MAAPQVQISYNDLDIAVYWDYDPTGTYVAYNLYWSFALDMAGETLLKGGITNTPDTNFSNKAILYKFNRASIGATENSVFYLRLKGIDSSMTEDSANPGEIKRICSLPEQLAQYHTSQAYGYDRNSNIWRKLKVTNSGSF